MAAFTADWMVLYVWPPLSSTYLVARVASNAFSVGSVEITSDVDAEERVSNGPSFEMRGTNEPETSINDSKIIDIMRICIHRLNILALRMG